MTIIIIAVVTCDGLVANQVLVRCLYGMLYGGRADRGRVEWLLGHWQGLIEGMGEDCTHGLHG
jgi:hypothetical protein